MWQVFNLRRLQRRSKVPGNELLYADDMDKNANSGAKMLDAMDQVSQSCGIYNQKTDVAHPPAHVKPYSEPTITVNVLKLKVVDKFTYLP